MGDGQNGQARPESVATRKEWPRCGSCDSVNIMRIEIAPLAVQICADCQSRVWTKNGEQVGNDVIFGIGDLEKDLGKASA